MFPSSFLLYTNNKRVMECAVVGVFFLKECGQHILAYFIFAHLLGNHMTFFL